MTSSEGYEISYPDMDVLHYLSLSLSRSPPTPLYTVVQHLERLQEFQVINVARSVFIHDAERSSERLLGLLIALLQVLHDSIQRYLRVQGACQMSAELSCKSASLSSECIGWPTTLEWLSKEEDISAIRQVRTKLSSLPPPPSFSLSRSSVTHSLCIAGSGDTRPCSQYIFARTRRNRAGGTCTC